MDRAEKEANVLRLLGYQFSALWDSLGFAALLFSFGYVALQIVSFQAENQRPGEQNSAIWCNEELVRQSWQFLGEGNICTHGGTHLRKKSALLIAFLASLAAFAVASPKLELSWKNPNYAGGTFKNILVLALNGKAVNRAEFEDELVAAISRPNGAAAPSYEFMPRPDATPIDMKDLRALVIEQKFDAIVSSRLTKRDVKTTYVPGETYTPLPTYGTFYGYYGAVSPVVYSPGYMKTEKYVQVEVNCYATAKPDGELVWTGTTNTFVAGASKKVIKDLVKIVTKELEKENIIERESK